LGLPGEKDCPLNGNHIEISKYPSKENDNFIRVAGNIGLVLKSLHPSQPSFAERNTRAPQSSAATVLNLDQPESLSTAKSLAYKYYEQGKWEESLYYLKHVLQEKKRTAQGQGNEEIFTLMNTIGKCYASLAKLDDALHWHQKGLELANRREDILEVVVSKCGIASVYQRMERLDDAREIYEDVLNTGKGTEIEASQVMAVARNSLAVMHMEAERFEDARRLFERGEEILLYDLRVANDDRDLLTLRANLGLNQVYGNRLDEGIRTLEDVYTISKTRYGRGDSITNLSRQNLVGAYGKAGRRDDMLVLFQEGFLQGQFQEFAELLQ
jgi:tetratricopeptide (TPR) repeat protein